MSLKIAEALEAVRAQLDTQTDYDISTVGESIYVRPGSELSDETIQTIDGTLANNRVIRFNERKDNAVRFDLKSA